MSQSLEGTSRPNIQPYETQEADTHPCKDRGASCAVLCTASWANVAVHSTAPWATRRPPGNSVGYVSPCMLQQRTFNRTDERTGLWKTLSARVLIFLKFSKWFSQTGSSVTGSGAHIPNYAVGYFLEGCILRTKSQVLISSMQIQLQLPQITTDKTCEFQSILPSRNSVLSLTQNAWACTAPSLRTTESYI